MKLKELGFYTGTVTGSYYSGTFEAVKAYQKANGIYPSGNADENTLEKLYADILAVNTPTPEPTETPAPTEELSQTVEPTQTLDPEELSETPIPVDGED